MKPEYVQIITKNTPELSKQIDLDHDLIGRLEAKDIITSAHASNLKTILVPEVRNVTLLDILKKRNNDCYGAFRKELAVNQKDLVDDYLPLPTLPPNAEEPGASATNGCLKPGEAAGFKTILTNDDIKKRVRDNYGKMAAKFDPKGPVLNELFGEGILTNAEYKKIKGIVEPEDRGEELLQNLLQGENPDAFIILRKAIGKEKAFKWMADIIDGV